MSFLKRLMKKFEFKTNLGHGSPVRELPTKALTPAQMTDLKSLVDRLEKSVLGGRKGVPVNFTPKVDLPSDYYGKETAKYDDLPKIQTHGRKGLGIKVAVDESIGGALTKKIHERGYDVVVRAGHAEKDEDWMKRALAEGALFVISPDLDIPSMIERENLPMVWIDFLFAGHVNPTLNADMSKSEKHQIWMQYVHDRIQSKLKFFKSEFGGKAL